MRSHPGIPCSNPFAGWNGVWGQMTAHWFRSMKEAMEGINRQNTDDSAVSPVAGQTGHGVVLVEPPTRSLPLVLASPHSGRDYPEDFFSAAKLDPISLRKSEDSFVDEIFSEAVALGAPMVKALFPRAYIDVNREPFELDPAMFAGDLPDYVNTRSPRVAAGLGTIARIVSHGQDIYSRKLRFEEALERINRHYRPYHAILLEQIQNTKERFGYCILVDCHSMPSENPYPNRGRRRGPHIDFVLGDAYGRSCSPCITAAAENALLDLGYGVVRNSPYAGGHTTRYYGQPEKGVHVLQLEINRALYMDEITMTRKPYITTLTARMSQVIARIGAAAANRK
jgi:N-formylglutamate amidohydrolase